ncbi:LamG domain-containing protein [Flammeovirga kamogawensis]|uniref:LamG-like jellyroll fold domain-containing protein n=1 Tax=Flammeovirga kamogawensis TaxID=373891 RepID=A0ABX8H199_9BACT|nr:LamG domain-containing protein [Flammeovirga kamogawensis]MBB6462238.1 hypothetical protein [Flammeovirga kamogawensis]QWG09362.1 hypothetical protein KM029_22410 [Flammeovirga kamogawensis]TRX64882.1 LamG domain-containing protein [Flammeovirga kamogawensis]
MKKILIFLSLVAVLASCGFDREEVKGIAGPPTNDARDTINVTPDPIEGIVLMYPQKDQKNITFDASVELNWEAEKLGLSYDVYLWKATEEKSTTPIVSKITNNFYVLSGLDKEQDYKWLVVGKNGVETITSQEGTFTSSKVSLNDVLTTKVIGLSFNNSVADDDGKYTVTSNSAKFTKDRFDTPNAAFEGSADRTESAAIVSNDATLNPGLMTVSVWVKPTDMANAGYIYSMQRWEGFSMKRESDARLKNMYFHETSEWGAVDFFTDEIALDKWTHVVITVDGISRKVYYNGALVSKIDAEGPVKFNAGNGADLIIGGQVENNNSNLSEFFTGGIDDFKIFSKALSADEVATFYNYESNYNPF